MLTIREYRRAESLEEAWQLNQKKNNRILGGMIWLNVQKLSIGTAIDLGGLSLDKIEEDSNQFKIGAMVTLRQLEIHPGLEDYTRGAVKEALRHIVGVQLRSMATVGGSIYGRFGFSDVLSVFLSMDSYVELYKGGLVPLKEYSQRGYDRDIVTAVIIRKEKADFLYQSVRNNQTDFPTLTCAAARLSDGSFRFALGARPGKACLFETNTEENAAAYGQKVSEALVTSSNLRGSAEYRKHLAKVFVTRAVETLENRKEAQVC